jgi:LytS/YehU family sensor histidine kinase
MYIFLVFASCILTVFVLVLTALYFQAKKKKEQIEEKYLALEHQIESMELVQLESKLSPHLFKNVLNSIQSHAYQTYYAMDKLSSVLDFILYESKNKYVTPKDEIDFGLNFIEINKIKLSPLFELKVKTKVNENEPLLTQKLIVPMISIDLIENAFKHADLIGQDAFISIVYELKDNKFYLTVSNKISEKPKLKKAKGGLGMETFEKRLKMIYQENFKLDRFTENDVYIVHLKINLLEHKAKMLAIR